VLELLRQHPALEGGLRGREVTARLHHAAAAQLFRVGAVLQLPLESCAAAAE
jgi:hypothetical protein